MQAKIVVACLLAIVALFLPFNQGQTLVSDDCLKCMCQASSYCNLTAPCTTGQQYLCGPYLIGFPYWQEAGQPVLDGDDPDGKDAHERCTSNKACAEKTVRDYMAIHEQDCTGDTIIDCEDFARLHYLGKDQCSDSMDGLPFYRVFRECWDKNKKSYTN